MTFIKPSPIGAESRRDFTGRALRTIERYLNDSVPSIGDIETIRLVLADFSMNPKTDFNEMQAIANLREKMGIHEHPERRTVDKDQDQDAADRFERAMANAKAAGQARAKHEDKLLDVLLDLGRNSASDTDTLIAVAGRMFHD